MSQPESLHKQHMMPPIFWKIVIPVVSGGFVYLVSNLTHQSEEWGLLLSAFVGGVVLVVQYLIDFDRGLRDVEERLAGHTVDIDDIVQRNFKKISKATITYATIDALPFGEQIIRLVGDATGLINSKPNVVMSLAKSELNRISSFLRQISEGEAVRDGEDQDWLLALVQQAEATIDATSTMAVDGGGKNFDDGFWVSSLGRKYLGAQRDAANRGVKIRRLFILNSLQQTEDPELQKICAMQTDAHILIRILAASEIPERCRGSLFDFILFDDLVSYEAIPASRIDPTVKPCVDSTRLIGRERHVEARRALFEELWEFGKVVV
jgi:hypothetical protein